MAGTVTRDTQTLPISEAISQGAAHISGSGTALDGATIHEPFVIFLDEKDPSRQVSPADETTLQEIAADLAPSAVAALSAPQALTASHVLVVADDTRRCVHVYNDTTTASLFLAYASTATTDAYTVKLPPGGYWEMPPQVYTGDIAGLWDAADGGFARITVLPGLLD